jgi:putative spermidine/putrescine transport system ATP-binding protein
LQLQQLSKRYGATQAVHELSLSVEQGEFVSLLGPSGCGKTTTLQMIAGFEPSAAGASCSTGATSPTPAPASAAWASCSRPMRCSRT